MQYIRKRTFAQTLTDAFSSVTSNRSISILSLFVILAALPVTILLINNQTQYYGHAAGTNDLFVSTSGGDSNPCTQAAPCATIQKAANVVQPGQTVHVAPGTYSYFANYANGNASARIVFVSDTKWGAKITNGSNPTNNGNALIYNAGNYVDIQGFEVYGVNVFMGIKNGGSYDRIIGNKVHDLAQTCNDNSSGIDNYNYSLPAVNDDIIGNIVYNVGPTTSCNTIQGIYHSVSGGHILSNISYHNSGYGIHCWHGCTNIVVANNTSFNNGKGGLVFGDGDEGAGIFDNSIVSNNIAYNNGNTGIKEYEYSGQHTIGSHNQFLNNLTYGNPSGNMLLIEGNTDQNTLYVDPQFVNYQPDGSGDYHLKSTSPAIDSGSSIDALNIDFDGNTRPQGNGYDRGAYEYGVATTPTPTTISSSCIASTTSWQNQDIASQTGAFEATFDVTPNMNGMDGDVGFSQNAASAYTDLADIVDFATTGVIQIRNGGNYQAQTTVNYTVGSTYHFRMDINVPAHTYSVYVTPPGSSEITLATNYTFRTEQASATSLNYWATVDGSGSLNVCNVTITPLATPTSTTATPSPTASPLSYIWIYNEGLVNGWKNVSSTSNNFINLANTSYPYSGAYDILWQSLVGYSFLNFNFTSFNTSGYTYLSFVMRASQTGQAVNVRMVDQYGNITNTISLSNYGGTPPAGSYRLYKVPLSALNAANKSIKAVHFMNATSTSQPAMYVDAIRFTN